MGRIRRVGVDTVTNYTFLETSAYDADNPAATTGAWSNDAAMDQTFRQANPSEVTAEGCLITFARFPDTFNGAMVKVQPTYDFDAGETPSLELWTHDSVTGDWTKRRDIDLTNPFVGVATGARKVFDLTFFPFIEDVDQVWITMNPGAVGTPTMDFAAIQLFGRCTGALPRGRNGGGGDPCADPNDPFYTGYDNEGNPCPGTTFLPPSDPVPTLDLCNPASIANYREYASTIPGFVEMFDEWLAVNAEAIALYCAGSTPFPPTDQPVPPSPTPLPPLDLCDDASIEAFRAAVAGNPDSLASFNTFIDGLEADGFFELACAPPLPPESYLNPSTLAFGPEPTEPTGRPFGQGDGGVPEPGADRPQDSTPPRHVDTGSGAPIEYFAFFFSGGAPDGTITAPSGTARAWMVPRFSDDAAYQEELEEVYGQCLQDNTVYEEADANTKTGIQFVFSGAVAGTVVNVRAIKIGIGGNFFLNPAGCFVDIGNQTMTGSGFGDPGPGSGTLGPVDTGLGTFATENPLVGSAYYRFNRTGTGEVNTLRISCPNDDPIGGGASNRGNAVMVRIIATPPSAGQAVTIVGGFY